MIPDIPQIAANELNEKENINLFVIKKILV